MFKFSNHSIEQLALRSITQEVVLLIINNPAEKIVENQITIYQKMIEENGKIYLLRVFVNKNKIPPLIITAYTKCKEYLVQKLNWYNADITDS